jgi:hypothetical protein
MHRRELVKRILLIAFALAVLVVTSLSVSIPHVPRARIHVPRARAQARELNPLVPATILMSHATTGTVVTVYPHETTVVTVTVEQIREAICPSLLKAAHRVIEPVSYKIQWFKQAGPGLRVLDEAAVVEGMVPNCKNVTIREAL